MREYLSQWIIFLVLLIDVASEDDAATVEHILKLMKPHIEEKIGVELEAAKIFTEAIRGVMYSVKQRPQYHIDPLQYAIQLASQDSISAYNNIRQLLFLPRGKHANKCKSNLKFGKDGTIKEGLPILCCKSML